MINYSENELILDFVQHFWEGSGHAGKYDLDLCHYNKDQVKKVLKKLGPVLKIKKKGDVEYIVLNSKKDFKPEHKIMYLQDQLEIYREESNKVYSAAKNLCSVLGL